MVEVAVLRKAVFALGVVLIAVEALSLASSNDDWEWKDNNRILTYDFELQDREYEKDLRWSADPRVLWVWKLNGQWKEWVEKAVEKWNAAETGWKLYRRWDLTKPADVAFVSGEFWNPSDRRTRCGMLYRWGCVCENGRESWTAAVIILNTGMIADCHDSAWSDDANDVDRLHPVRVILHEIGHAFLLDHDNTQPDNIMYAYQCVGTGVACACRCEAKPLRSTELSPFDVGCAKNSCNNKRALDDCEEIFKARSYSYWLDWGEDCLMPWLDVNVYLFFRPCAEGFSNWGQALPAVSYWVARGTVRDLLETRFTGVENLERLVPLWYPAASQESELYREFNSEETENLIRSSGLAERTLTLLITPGSWEEDVGTIVKEILSWLDIQVEIRVRPEGYLWWRETDWDVKLIAPQTYPDATDELLDALMIYPYLSCSDWSWYSAPEELSKALDAETWGEAEEHLYTVQRLIAPYFIFIPLVSGRFFPAEEEPGHHQY